MKEEVISASILSKSATTAIAFLFVIAIIGFLAAGINTFGGTPKELEGSTPYFLLTGVVFTLLGLWYHYHKRGKLSLLKDGDREVLVLKNDGKEYRTHLPLNYHYEYLTYKIQGNSMCRLSFFLLNQDLLIELNTDWGTFHGTPEHWPPASEELPMQGFSEHIAMDVSGKYTLVDLVKYLQAGKQEKSIT